MRMQTLLCTLLFLCLSAPTCSQWNVECDRSASGVSYTPHDNSRHFNPTSVSLGFGSNFLRRGLGTGQDETPVYIYLVNTTSAECNSTLVAIQYCYVRTGGIRSTQPATFLALDRDDSGVIAYREFPLQSNETSGGANCASIVEGTFFCCVITNLSNSQQFAIPSSPSTPFAFGLVVNRSSDVQLVSFNTSTAPIIIDGYQVSSYTRGQRIVLAEESGVQLGLPLIRLGIATDGLTTPEDTLSTTTSDSADIPMTTTPKAVLSTVTPAQPATTTRLPNDPATTSPPSASEVFQCQPSSDQSGQVYTPNIPDFYFAPSNVATGESDRSLSPNFPSTSSTRRAVYIFPIPIESKCSGTVVAIQYCYSGRESDLNSLLTVVQNFLALDGNGTRRNSNTLIESVPSNDKCVASSGRIHCCDTMHLRQEQQFEIPPTPVPFAFGLRINRNSDGQLLTFSDISYDYVVNGYQEISPLSQPVVFTNPIQLGFPVLRLLIDLEPTPNSTMSGSNEQTTMAIIGAAIAGSLLFLLIAVITGVALLLHVRIRRKKKTRRERMESTNPIHRNGSTRNFTVGANECYAANISTAGNVAYGDGCVMELRENMAYVSTTDDLNTTTHLYESIY